VSWYQKGKTNLDFTEVRDSEWQWHQLGHMQVCTSLQTDNHTSNPPLSFFTGRMPFRPPNRVKALKAVNITVIVIIIIIIIIIKVLYQQKGYGFIDHLDKCSHISAPNS